MNTRHVIITIAVTIVLLCLGDEWLQNAQTVLAFLRSNAGIGQAALAIVGAAMKFMQDKPKDEGPQLKDTGTLKFNDFPKSQPNLEAHRIRAELLFQEGKYDASYLEFYILHKLLSENSGSGPAETLKAQSDMGKVLLKLGKLTESQDLLTNVWSNQAKLLGETHPDTLQTQHLLACILELLGESKKALLRFEAVLEQQSLKLGKYNSDTLTTQAYLGKLHSQVGNLQQAEVLLLEVLKIRESTLPQNHPDLLEIQMFYGDLLNEKGNSLEAKGILESVVERRKAHFGTHPDTLRAQFHLAKILSSLGELKEAEKMYKNVILFQTIFFGPSHYLTEKTKLALNSMSKTDPLSTIKTVIIFLFATALAVILAFFIGSGIGVLIGWEEVKRPEYSNRFVVLILSIAVTIIMTDIFYSDNEMMLINYVLNAIISAILALLLLLAIAKFIGWPEFEESNAIRVFVLLMLLFSAAIFFPMKWFFWNAFWLYLILCAVVVIYVVASFAWCIYNEAKLKKNRKNKGSKSS